MRTSQIESFDEASRLTIEIEEALGFDARWSVGLHTPQVTAHHGFWSGKEPERFVAFFEDLARGWRGWDGDRALSTMEHDLGLLATHDGQGHVVLWVRLDPNLVDVEKTWHVVAPLELEAGALDRIAAQLRTEFTAQ